MTTVTTVRFGNWTNASASIQRFSLLKIWQFCLFVAKNEIFTVPKHEYHVYKRYIMADVIKTKCSSDDVDSAGQWPL